MSRNGAKFNPLKFSLQIVAEQSRADVNDTEVLPCAIIAKTTGNKLDIQRSLMENITTFPELERSQLREMSQG